MPNPEDSDRCLPQPLQPAVLVVLGQTTGMDGLRSTLEGLGHGFDVTRSRGEALARFFATGGHDALLLAPDVAPGMAWALAAAIVDMDPDIPVVAFGTQLARSPNRLPQATMVTDHHPDSRAGEAAVLHALGVTPAHPDLLDHRGE